MIKRSFGVLCCLLIVVGCGSESKKAAFAPISTVSEDGVTIPIYDYNGIASILKQENDTTYVVNFWATWCKPCVKELPFFEMLNKHYADKKVKVLLVSLDMESQLKSKLIPFIKKRQIESEILVLDDPDANNWITKVDNKWTGAIPATLIYNKRERFFYERSFTYKELETEVKKIL